MKSFAIFTALSLSVAPLVAAHGYVPWMTVDGKRYNGPNPGKGSKTPSVIRQVSSINPINGANSASINCGPGAQPASLSATAKPGSSLEFMWKASPNQNWPHNTGPALTYMADCNGDCNKFDSNKAKWFKIGQDGLSNGKWAQARFDFVGKPSPAKIPNNLKAGNYLVAHQFISLHLANKARGAEFYSSCTQLKVTGSGTGVPSANELVSFPGGYSDNDKGILVNAFNANLKYQFPGPAVAKLAGRADPVNNNGGEEPEEPETPETPETPSKPETPENNEGGSCKKSTKSKRSKKAKRSAEYKPRHISRVMRDIAADLGESAH